MKIVSINCDEINDWKGFHACFKKTFGFPDFYGENMNAWIDCMANLDEEFSAIQIEEGDVLTLIMENVTPFKKRCPDIYDALIESSAFVNHRRMDMGQKPILVLSFYK
jgi:RNAse (barnase) inhibitor barstar